jgi:hypothetical protein
MPEDDFDIYGDDGFDIPQQEEEVCPLSYDTLVESNLNNIHLSHNPFNL